MIATIETPARERPRILFVDAFDSFSNNITGLLEECLGAHVTLVHIDDEDVNQHLDSVVHGFDAVVVGPGPGHPANTNDTGFINKLWKLDGAHLLPVLGICLGFQSLCLSQGAEVKRLKKARHGIVSRVSHAESDIWAGIEDCDATQYHSLHVGLGNTNNQAVWYPTKSCPKLQPLAWDLGDDFNGPILSSARHVEKPFWGVQFHPESICTSAAGRQLIINWWSHAQAWLDARSWPVTKGCLLSAEAADEYSNVYLGASPPRISCSSQLSDEFLDDWHPTVKLWEDFPRPAFQPQILPFAAGPASHMAEQLRSVADCAQVYLRYRVCSIIDVQATEIVEALGQNREEVILLDSQGHATGRYSIVGLVVPGKTMKVAYSVYDRKLRYGFSPDGMCDLPVESVDEVWPILQEAIDLVAPQNDEVVSESSLRYNHTENVANSPVQHLPEDSPFWGGFMGYISYEAGLETIDVDLHKNCTSGETPDINFAFVHRSIVIDHQDSRLYVQSLLPDDQAWINATEAIINDLSDGTTRRKHTAASSSPVTDLKISAALDTKMAESIVSRPDEYDYRAKVLDCQRFLSSGDSYELCLTDETDISVPVTDSRGVDEWALYKRLRTKNPAPFGAFLRVSDVTVVGSSPERFLKWTRDGHCQFRPIKGTVKKSPSMARERAHEILNSSKERAENLMIVDLIRHDLSGVIGASNTWVPQLMEVEEYQTVYQLVSVIEGELPPPDAQGRGPRGLDVLKASLPPGSMTGAPKKRSCEILRDIERRPRGVYSGVLGYMDVGGAGDFSVVIRTLVRGQAGADNDTETWKVGAGGAVTIQSTDEAEFHEMETKASSVLAALFGDKSELNIQHKV